MEKHMRTIGRIGTASRVVVGLGLLYLALADGLSWASPGARRCSGSPSSRRSWLRSGSRRASLRVARFTSILLHGGRGRTLLRGDDVRCRLAGTAGLRGDRTLELDPPPRRPDRLPDLRADRRGGGAPERPQPSAPRPGPVGRSLKRIQNDEKGGRDEHRDRDEAGADAGGGTPR